MEFGSLVATRLVTKVLSPMAYRLCKLARLQSHAIAHRPLHIAHRLLRIKFRLRPIVYRLSGGRAARRGALGAGACTGRAAGAAALRPGAARAVTKGLEWRPPAGGPGEGGPPEWQQATAAGMGPGGVPEAWGERAVRAAMGHRSCRGAWKHL